MEGQWRSVTAVTINRAQGHSPPLSRFEILGLDLEPRPTYPCIKGAKLGFVEFLNAAKYLTPRRKHRELSVW
jgi:hypothetical protein